MATDKKLTIAYSGSLEGYTPRARRSKWYNMLSWVWTFRNTTVDPSTRSGHFFIEAVNILVKKYQILPSQLQVQWWGLIHARNQQQVDLLGLADYFTIDGYLPKAASLARLQEADVLFLPLEKSTSQQHKTLFIPGKLFEYLRAGKPILSLCEESDCKEIIRQANLGIFAEADQPEEIATALLPYIVNPDLLKTFQPNIAYINRHSFHEKTKELADLLNELV